MFTHLIISHLNMAHGTLLGLELDLTAEQGRWDALDRLKCTRNNVLGSKPVHARSMSGSMRAAPTELTWKRTRWLLVFNCHTGLPQTAYGKAWTPNVAWRIYKPSADLTTVHRWGRYVTCSHMFQETQPMPPPPPGFLPAGPSRRSPFSCLVYSSSSTHNPLQAGGPSLAPLFPWVFPAAESKAGEELLYLDPKSSHQMRKVRVTHADFYEESNEQTALCPGFVVKILQYIKETIHKKVKNARFRHAVA